MENTSSCSRNHRNSAIKALAVGIGLLGGAFGAVEAAQYTVVMLHSPLVPHQSSLAVAIADGQQVGYTAPNSPAHRALLWNATAKSVIDLHPAGYSSSAAYAVAGGKQYGNAYHPGVDQIHPLVWNGSANNYVNLFIPSLGAHKFQDNWVFGAVETEQVGTAAHLNTNPVALKWNGTAESAALLHPEHLSVLASIAYATDGHQQVGWGGWSPTGHIAVLWQGTAESAVDLTPAGAASAIAVSVSGGQQVGGVQFFGIGWVAALWHGSRESFVRLSPEGHTSAGRGTNGVQQVGNSRLAEPDAMSHAVVWTGSAETMFDLHQFFPHEWNLNNSIAYGIDEQGNVAGGAYRFEPGAHIPMRAVLWIKQYETLPPQGFDIERGILSAGNLNSLVTTDGNRLVVRPGLTLSTAEAPVSVIVQTTAPVSNPLYAQAIVTMSGSVTNLRATVEAYNFLLGEWIALQNDALPTSDETYTLQLKKPSEFIGPNGEMLTRIRARQAGPVISFPWFARFDEISWRFSEK